jgi:hypothetical protein
MKDYLILKIYLFIKKLTMLLPSLFSISDPLLIMSIFADILIGYMFSDKNLRKMLLLFRNAIIMKYGKLNFYKNVGIFWKMLLKKCLIFQCK